MLNIIIPMAGEGTRFINKGFSKPKPFIDVNGKPMIQLVIDNLKIKTDHRFIFIFQKKHNDVYNFKDFLKNYLPNCETVEIDGLTKGPAMTVLCAADYINDDDDLLIANSDQFVDIDFNDFINSARSKNLDGLIMTFLCDKNPKWSFVKLNEQDLVIETAEKNPISDIATVGIYYFKKGGVFIDAITQMVLNKEEVNGEFYVCPVYNYLIKNNLKVGHYVLKDDQMHGLGTPEDLEKYLNKIKSENNKS